MRGVETQKEKPPTSIGERLRGGDVAMVKIELRCRGRHEVQKMLLGEAEALWLMKRLEEILDEN